ncbi:uncharacterized protein UV8b_07550 [Ustilaginoidea virens]|uniref:Uncharacterized protein n=1 Tax=Ustilaginoidea virens TaxID=1159556 RepID=A0A8E5HY41_USTVR|nr:uncharacterized protein UV8b_07550 [Ustilaginoidea virens]QUC23309.1 hypothetical protein UV8b_07550 [Ustilaginoidea virens]
MPCRDQLVAKLESRLKGHDSPEPRLYRIAEYGGSRILASKVCGSASSYGTRIQVPPSKAQRKNSPGNPEPCENISNISNISPPQVSALCASLPSAAVSVPASGRPLFCCPFVGLRPIVSSETH